MNHWAFVAAAYATAAVLLAGYWWWVERRIRALEGHSGARGEVSP
ncbi:MAG TPA: hypothetical protein VGW35_19665 [Methylomirabilota bacterium]|nr:hypothetical protein [Methylomirabilota bacterium]